MATKIPLCVEHGRGALFLGHRSNFDFYPGQTPARGRQVSGVLINCRTNSAICIGMADERGNDWPDFNGNLQHDLTAKAAGTKT